MTNSIINSKLPCSVTANKCLTKLLDGLSGTQCHCHNVGETTKRSSCLESRSDFIIAYVPIDRKAIEFDYLFCRFLSDNAA